jgi:hypothetical protein
MRDFYLIPAGALRSADIENLFFAGKHISSSDEAIASARVIGTCMSTGVAAGLMAALQCENYSEADAIAAVRRSELLI